VNVVVGSYLQGVSGRKNQDITQHPGIEHLSSASIFGVAKNLDELAREFLNRLIEEAVPYLYVDASC